MGGMTAAEERRAKGLAEARKRKDEFMRKGAEQKRNTRIEEEKRKKRWKPPVEEIDEKTVLQEQRFEKSKKDAQRLKNVFTKQHRPISDVEKLPAEHFPDYFLSPPALAKARRDDGLSPEELVLSPGKKRVSAVQRFRSGITKLRSVWGVSNRFDNQHEKIAAETAKLNDDPRHMLGHIIDVDNNDAVAEAINSHEPEFDFLAEKEHQRLAALESPDATSASLFSSTDAGAREPKQSQTVGQLHALSETDHVQTWEQKEAALKAVMMSAKKKEKGFEGPEVAFVAQPGNKYFLSDKLISAARKNNLAELKMARLAGATVDHEDSHGFTALHHACRRGHIEIAHWLLHEARANANAQSSRGHVGNGYTPLMEAAVRDDKPLMAMLLQREEHPDPKLARFLHGIDVNARSKAGFTAVMIAAQRRCLQALEMLVQKDLLCDLDAQDVAYGWTALHHACAVEGDKGLPSVVLLVEAGCNFDVQDFEGRSAVRIATDNGNDQILRFLSQMTGTYRVPAARIRDPFPTVEETVWCCAPYEPPTGFRTKDELKTTALRKTKVGRSTKTLEAIKQSQFSLQTDVIREEEEKRREKRRKRRKQRKQREEVRKIMLYKAAGVDVSGLDEMQESISGTGKKKQGRGDRDVQQKNKLIARAVGGEVRMSAEARVKLLASLENFDEKEKQHKQKIRDEIRRERRSKGKKQKQGITLDATLKKMNEQPQLWSGATGVKSLLMGKEDNPELEADEEAGESPAGPETEATPTPPPKKAVKSAW